MAAATAGSGDAAADLEALEALQEQPVDWDQASRVPHNPTRHHRDTSHGKRRSRMENLGRHAS